MTICCFIGGYVPDYFSAFSRCQATQVQLAADCGEVKLNYPAFTSRKACHCHVY